jgi:hypothetical protein
MGFVMTVLYNIIALVIVVVAAAVVLRNLLPARLAQRLRLKAAPCAAPEKSGCAGCKGGCR